MRILVTADIHANLEALTEVIEVAERGGSVDSVWCLGDVVGYGPDPNGCIGIYRAQSYSRDLSYSESGYGAPTARPCGP